MSVLESPYTFGWGPSLTDGDQIPVDSGMVRPSDVFGFEGLNNAGNNITSLLGLGTGQEGQAAVGQPTENPGSGKLFIARAAAGWFPGAPTQRLIRRLVGEYKWTEARFEGWPVPSGNAFNWFNDRYNMSRLSNPQRLLTVPALNEAYTVAFVPKLVGSDLVPVPKVLKWTPRKTLPGFTFAKQATGSSAENVFTADMGTYVGNGASQAFCLEYSPKTGDVRKNLWWLAFRWVSGKSHLALYKLDLTADAGSQVWDRVSSTDMTSWSSKPKNVYFGEYTRTNDDHGGYFWYLADLGSGSTPRLQWRPIDMSGATPAPTQSPPIGTNPFTENRITPEDLAAAHGNSHTSEHGSGYQCFLWNRNRANWRGGNLCVALHDGRLLTYNITTSGNRTLQAITSGELSGRTWTDLGGWMIDEWDVPDYRTAIGVRAAAARTVTVLTLTGKTRALALTAGETRKMYHRALYLTGTTGSGRVEVLFGPEQEISDV